MATIKNKNDYYQEVYPFTTEMISGYLPDLALQDKSVLTVGSSSDQVLNALMLGANSITLYDINKYTEAFYKLKRDMILTTPREELITKVLEDKSLPYSNEVFAPKQIIKMNPYLQNNKNYNLLRKNLTDAQVSFVQGDIFSMDESLAKNAKFDRIIFSNVLQALDLFAKINHQDPYQFLSENFAVWNNHLNKDGILQLIYLYTYSLANLKTKNTSGLSIYDLKKVVEALEGYPLQISFFEDCFDRNEDAIVTYTKK